MKSIDDFIARDIRLFYGTNLDTSAYQFQELIYEFLTEREYKCVLEGTELKFILAKLFEPSLNLGDFSGVDNSLVSLLTALTGSPIVSDMLFFYGGIYSNDGSRDLFEELKASWEDHRNGIYRLGSLMILHLVGMFIVKENLC
jgi:hypothetical protein